MRYNLWEISLEWGRRSGLRQLNEGKISRKLGRADCRNDFSNTLKTWLNQFHLYVLFYGISYITWLCYLTQMNHHINNPVNDVLLHFQMIRKPGKHIRLALLLFFVLCNARNLSFSFCISSFCLALVCLWLYNSKGWI